MKFVDFDKCEKIKSMAYGGRAGRKIAVLYEGEPWLVKFPESTKEFPGRDKANMHLPSYTTSPLSEYIGSKVYASLGIPVHETLLGKCDGKVVVGCKDFAVDVRLIDFGAIKNTVIEDALEHGNSSSDKGEFLSEALRVIDVAEGFEGIREQVKERFWDMFVIDAFILNNDRNNGNWGLLAKRFSMELAPVYDNGNAFFNKKDNSLIERHVDNEKAIWGDIKTVVSFFKGDDGKFIHPFTYLAQHQNSDCDKAMARFMERIDMSEIIAIVDGIPTKEEGFEIISAAQKNYYKSLLALTYGQGITTAVEGII